MAKDITIGLDDQVTPGLQKIGDAVGKLPEQFAKLGGTTIRNSLGMLGEAAEAIPLKYAAAAGAVLALSKSLAEGLKGQREFHDAMVGARIATGQTTAEIRSMAGAIKEVSGKTVSLLDAMRLISRASEFKIGIKEQADLFKFAAGRARQMGQDFSAVAEQVTASIAEGSSEALTKMSLLGAGIDGVRAHFDQLNGLGAFDKLSEDARKAQVRIAALAAAADQAKIYERMGLTGMSDRQQVEKLAEALAHPLDSLSAATKKATIATIDYADAVAGFLIPSVGRAMELSRKAEDQTIKEIAAQKKAREELAKEDVKRHQIAVNVRRIEDEIADFRHADRLKEISEGKMLLSSLQATEADYQRILAAMRLLAKQPIVDEEALKKLRLALGDARAESEQFKAQAESAKGIIRALGRSSAADAERRTETPAKTLDDILERQRLITLEIKAQKDAGKLDRDAIDKHNLDIEQLEKQRSARFEMDEKFRLLVQGERLEKFQEETEIVNRLLDSKAKILDQEKRFLEVRKQLAREGKLQGEEEKKLEIELAQLKKKRLDMKEADEGRRKSLLDAVKAALGGQGGDGGGFAGAAGPVGHAAGAVGKRNPYRNALAMGNVGLGGWGAFSPNIGIQFPGSDDLGGAMDFDPAAQAARLGGATQHRDRFSKIRKPGEDIAKPLGLKQIVADKFRERMKAIDDAFDKAVGEVMDKSPDLDIKQQNKGLAAAEAKAQAARNKVIRDRRGGVLDQEARDEKQRQGIKNVGDALRAQGKLNDDSIKVLAELTDQAAKSKKQLEDQGQQLAAILAVLKGNGMGVPARAKPQQIANQRGRQ